MGIHCHPRQHALTHARMFTSGGHGEKEAHHPTQPSVDKDSHCSAHTHQELDSDGLWLMISPPQAEGREADYRSPPTDAAHTGQPPVPPLSSQRRQAAPLTREREREAARWGWGRGKWARPEDASMLVVRDGLVWERSLGPPATLLLRQQVWLRLGRPHRFMVEALVDVGTWYPARCVGLGGRGSVLVELDLLVGRWYASELPQGVDALEAEAGAVVTQTVVEDQSSVLLFMRSVSGALVAVEQTFNGAISNAEQNAMPSKTWDISNAEQNAGQRRWWTHGHPPGTRLAAAPVADVSGLAERGVFVVSVDGRLWNRRRLKAGDVFDAEEAEAHKQCAGRDLEVRPSYAWIFEDLGRPSGGLGNRLSCAPVVVPAGGSGRVIALTRDGAPAVVSMDESGRWKWEVLAGAVGDAGSAAAAAARVQFADSAGDDEFVRLGNDEGRSDEGSSDECGRTACSGSKGDGSKQDGVHVGEGEEEPLANKRVAFEGHDESLEM